jgi:hypothetical protein
LWLRWGCGYEHLLQEVYDHTGASRCVEDKWIPTLLDDEVMHGSVLPREERPNSTYDPRKGLILMRRLTPVISELVNADDLHAQHGCVEAVAYLRHILEYGVGGVEVVGVYQ